MNAKNNVIHMNTIDFRGIQGRSIQQESINQRVTDNSTTGQIIIGEPVVQQTQIIPGTIGWEPPCFPWYSPPEIGIGSFLTVDLTWKVEELHDRIVLSMDVPGVDPNQLKVEIENFWLRVSGNRIDNGLPVVGHRVISTDYDVQTTEAEVQFGVLRITVLKTKVKTSVLKIPVTVK